MKNLDKIIKNILILFWLGLCCTTLKAEVVITEFFILQADSTHTPQYIELYNNSNSQIDLTYWSITTKDSLDGDVISVSPFNDSVLDVQPYKIDPFGYFLISSSWCNYSTFGCNFYNEFQSESHIIFPGLILPFKDPSFQGLFEDKGSIVLTSDIYDTNVEEDRIDYDIATGWPVGDNSRGHSLRLHIAPGSDDNNNPDNWSLSPDTEKSLWLYDEGEEWTDDNGNGVWDDGEEWTDDNGNGVWDDEEIKSFGSPREENSFRLNGVEDFYHIISGDVNNEYNADNNYDDNNYGVPLEFSWEGTLIDTTVFVSPAINYKIIIEKQIIETNGEAVNDPIWVNIPDTPDTSWLYIEDTSISILPFNFLIDSLGIGREIAKYSWTVELTKTFSNDSSNDSTDTIYSDKYTFTIDASDYGRYGCVDNGCCTNDPNEVDENDGCPRLCPTSAFYEEPYKSNHPTECTPGNDISAGGCYSALNYYEDANINSNTCHYVSLSIPAFVVGDPNNTVRVPVYFKNDSLAEINEIEFTLNYADSSIVEYAGGNILETVLFGLNDTTINAEPVSDSVIISLSSARIAGIITYLYFNLSDLQGEFTDLTISEVRVNGGNPINDIFVPVSGEGELVILQTDYEIYGQVYYYDSSIGEEPFRVPKVDLTLSIMYDGVSADTSYDTSSPSGYFIFNSLTEGNYNLSFSKDSNNDCNGNYISGTDISRIARHVIGSEPFNTDQLIAADVSLDGTVSGYDVSLVAQYAVDLIDNFNDIPTHWIFKPLNLQTLPDVHAELVKENGQYSIEYKPLVLDDKSRNISAYRLGDVNGNYCHDQLSRYNNNQVQFTNIAIDYTPVITFPLIIPEPIFLEGMDIEIGYDEDVFSPHSITFNTSNIKTERYNYVSNLLSRDGSIKTVTWAIDEPQIVEGIIGEVSFNWNNKNKSGKIWLKEFQVNDEPAVGGISLIGLNDNDVADGVNIINSLVPVELSLHQNYPNPFNPQTTIKWSMPLSGIVSLEVYNLKGQYIDHLFYGFKEVGMHEQEWDATAYPSGIYFYRLKTHEKTLQKIMLLLK